MALPPSGAIRMSQIKTELGSSSNSLRIYSAAAGKTAPDAMSEFYSYTQPPSYFYYSAEYCGSSTPLVVRFDVDQIVNSVFETPTPYVCVRLTEITFGPSYDIDLGDGSSYVGTSCSSCPSPPAPPPPPVTYDYYDYEPCTGPGAYSGAQYTLQVVAGYSPACIFYNGETYSQVGLGAYSGPANYTLFSGTEVNCGSCE
jgi:hypothetical protein